MARYAVNDLLVIQPDQARFGDADEVVPHFRIDSEADLTFDHLILELKHTMAVALADEPEALQAAIDAWAETNRKYHHRRIAAMPMEPGLHAYLYITDLCHAGLYVAGYTEDGADIWRADDPAETPVMTLYYHVDETLEAHKAFVDFTVSAMNDAWRRTLSDAPPAV